MNEVKDLKLQEHFWKLIQSGKKTLEFRKEKHKDLDNEIVHVVTPEGKSLGYLHMKLEWMVPVDKIIGVVPVLDEEAKFIPDYYKDEKKVLVFRVREVKGK